MEAVSSSVAAAAVCALAEAPSEALERAPVSCVPCSAARLISTAVRPRRSAALRVTSSVSRMWLPKSLSSPSSRSPRWRCASAPFFCSAESRSPSATLTRNTSSARAISPISSFRFWPAMVRFNSPPAIRRIVPATSSTGRETPRTSQTTATTAPRSARRVATLMKMRLLTTVWIASAALPSLPVLLNSFSRWNPAVRSRARAALTPRMRASTSSSRPARERSNVALASRA